MKEEQKEKVSDLCEIWLKNPYTEILRKEVVKAEDLALRRLLGHCSESSDPEVRASYASFTSTRITSGMLHKGVRAK